MSGDLHSEIWHFFHDVPVEADECSLYTDTFYTLCWMHSNGETVAAKKLMPSLLQRVNRLYGNEYSQLVNKILRHFSEGNEKVLADSVSARIEFIRLFDADKTTS